MSRRHSLTSSINNVCGQRAAPATVRSVRSRRFQLVTFHISILPREMQGSLVRLRDLVRSHFTGREGGMTTVWRPRVRIAVPDIDGADADEKRREELTKKGTKRKRAPKHRGPCEHGVKYRSNCKVCSGCPHGRHRRSQCKECGGSGICEHGRQRSVCKECGGASICEHGRVRSNCRECGGSSICEHGRQRCRCKECGGGSICEHGRERTRCKECGGGSICEHGRIRSVCKECHAAK